MIVFDLECGAHHVFEAWFGSTEDYEAQRGRGLVQCPLCGTDRVDKAVMAPRVAAKGNSRPAAAAAPAAPGADPAQRKAMLAALAKAQAAMLAEADYVGRDFAGQARAMHAGEREAAAIYGEVNRDEARALIEDGVPVAPLPLPLRPPGDTH